MDLSSHLRTSVRRAIIGPFIAHLLPARISVRSPTYDPCRRRPDRPPRTRVPAGPPRCRPGRGRRPGVRPLRQHQTRLRLPVAHLPRLVRRGGSAVPTGGAPHRGPLPGRPRQCRRQHRHHAPGHQCHLESPRMGEAGIALPGPGRARLFKGMGKTTCEATASVRRPHRRCARRHPPHRRPAPQARPRLRNARAGCRKGEV